MNNSHIPKTMHGVLLTGHGGLDNLEYRDNLAVPVPASNEVLIRVGATAINNTDINTRTGWYSKTITSGRGEGAEAGFGKSSSQQDSSWSGKPLRLPRIQGADVCGTIVAVGRDVHPSRIGERVLVRPMQQSPDNTDSHHLITFGSECDGGYAQYTVARSTEVFAINSGLSDVQLASFPCAYSTAEGMLERASLKANEKILITGASGGVGSAAVQLAKRRGAHVIAVCAEAKRADILNMGADEVIARERPLREQIETESIHVVADLVAGTEWPALLDVLIRGGRYVVSGAIAGPMVSLDVRTLYLKDLTFFGATWQPRHVFENLIGYIERDEIRPIVAKTYSLNEVAQAQRDFIGKRFSGKLAIAVGDAADTPRETK
ncbi:alcohol dehydrogenase family protein [Alcanivorax sp.]|jgi:NADPH:quinone reductase-like Zn-dependent oxidoreductase|uniref:alcohol dehydrogenase family protein n=1 Tax=Alcanivorax sp. TaxID=1872427 RepID=UPI0032D9457A